MIIKITKKIIITLVSYVNPIYTAKRIGVTVGDSCSFSKMPDFGSEPYLVTLGNHVRTSSQVTFITHDGSTWCFRDQEKYKHVIRYGKISVGDNCFIGYRAIILPNVRVGNNCIIAAGSVVTKDVPDGSVVAGVPAQIISTTEYYAEKCLNETLSYDREEYKKNKKRELNRILNNIK